MVNRNKSTIFYLLLVVVASVVVGMVLASRLDLASQSSAQTAIPAVNSSPITGPVTATTFRDVAKAVSPAVVNVRTKSMQPAQGGDLSELFGGGLPPELDRLFPGQRPPRGQNENGDTPRRRQQQPREEFEVVRAAGTGFIIDKSGLILTNNHVVEGATEIRVSLYGDDEDQDYTARVVGRDQLTDSALLQLTQKPDRELPTAKFGDSAQMQPGDWVIAIGNPFNLDHTVSVGVISGSRGASDRGALQVAAYRRAEVIQTDAAINPGNSGGPLINLRGEVIGMNTAIATTGMSQGNMGVGFAIPSNALREVLPQLRSGKVTRGRVGVQVGAVRRQDIDELGLKEKTGALVIAVEEKGPAEKAGVEIGDVILGWNGQPVRNSDELVQMVVRTKPGASIPVRIVREKKDRTLNITVDELDLETEGNSNRRVSSEQTSAKPEPNKGFGMTLENVTANCNDCPGWGGVTRRVKLPDTVRGAVITDIDPGSPADEQRLALGDIIYRVGSTPVTSAVEAQRELNKVPAGGTALLRIVRPANTIKGYQELFLTVSKD
jgi:serine protease Do